jgi:hypothetical protein
MFENVPEFIPYTILILAVAGIGLWMYKDELRFQFKSKTTEGTIVNWMASTQGGKKYFYPVIEFQPEDGQKQRFRVDDRCEGAPLYDQGTAVKVKYDPLNFTKITVQYPSKKA